MIDEIEIHAIRCEVERKRTLNNRTFMDWWEMSMNCPNCQAAAMRYQGKIRKQDLEVCEVNRPVSA